MVGHYSHSHIDVLLLAITEAAEVADGFDDGLEDVGIVVGLLALNGANQAFEAHAGVDNVHSKRFEMSISLALVLHEDDVPDLDNLRVVLVDEFAARHFSLFLSRTTIEMNLRARSARTCVAHFPEVIMLVAVDDVVGRNVLQPVACSLIIADKILFRTALEDRHIEVLRVELQHINEVFPRHIDGSLLEIVAERPVAEHLEHRVVIGIMPDFFQIIMLSADTQTLLAVRTSAGFRVASAKDDVLPLVHAGIGKHQGRVILHYHRGRRNNLMTLRLEVLKERVAYLICCHSSIIHNSQFIIHNHSIRMKMRANVRNIYELCAMICNLRIIFCIFATELCIMNYKL